MINYYGTTFCKCIDSLLLLTKSYISKYGILQYILRKYKNNPIKIRDYFTLILAIPILSDIWSEKQVYAKFFSNTWSYITYDLQNNHYQLITGVFYKNSKNFNLKTSQV